MSYINRKDSSNLENVLGDKGYIIKSLLGKGSYAKVYLAEYHSGNNRQQLACKLIDTSKAPREYLFKFLPREIDAHLRLVHPYIVGVHSIYQKRARYLIFLRYAENGDVLDFITNNGAICEKQARIWMRQIASGLEYMHAMEVAHRDLKCENILITANFNVKIADFGFARSCVDWSYTEVLSSTYCGSLCYAAPEILKGEPYQPKKSDIWSLGVIFYTMLNKRLPFDDNSIKKLYQKQMKSKWRFQSEVVNTLSFPCKKLVADLLEPRSDHRPKPNEIINGEWIMMDPKLIHRSTLEEKLLHDALMAIKNKTASHEKTEFEKFAALKKKHRTIDGLKILQEINDNPIKSQEMFTKCHT